MAGRGQQSSENVAMVVTSTEGEVLPPEEQKGKAKSRTLTKAEIKELQATFQYFDKDKDGHISSKELGFVMRSLGQNPTDSEMRDILNEVDADGVVSCWTMKSLFEIRRIADNKPCSSNGQLDFDEFVTMMTIHMKTTTEMEKELKQSFKVFDINGDGFISASELKQAMTTIGEKMTEKDINDIIKQWDSDGDGKISYEEFVKAMVADNIFK